MYRCVSEKTRRNSAICIRGTRVAGVHGATGAGDMDKTGVNNKMVRSSCAGGIPHDCLRYYKDFPNIKLNYRVTYLNSF